MNIRLLRRLEIGNFQEISFSRKNLDFDPKMCHYDSWQHSNNIKDMLSLSISLVESTNHKRNKGINSLFHINPKYLFLISNFYKQHLVTEFSNVQKV